MTDTAAPPSATGPAGAQFEAKVAASFLLGMLRGSEPRGLPGTTFDRIDFQRAAEGHPLDDIVVHAHDQQGAAATLEVQCKRSITFAPRDAEFRTVVVQVAAAIAKPEFAAGRYELAIATEQATRAITGPYQEVLNHARKMESAASFMARLERAGSASKDMRTFVDTLRANLAAAGAAGDDETVWTVLRRLQIQVYDFAAPGSAHETYARDRSADVLHAADRGKAGALWSTLVARAIDLGASGGATDRGQLVDGLKGDFRFDGDRRYPVIRAAIAEAAQQALGDMSALVHGVALDRTARVADVRTAVGAGRYVEIRGDAGVGKSGLLKHLAEEIARESRMLVLTPGRIAERGWTAMRVQIGFEGTLRELLSDLASDGGGWVFIDNLDSYTPSERLTVIDIVHAASEVAGVTVVATARRRFGIDEPSWLPDIAVQTLVAAPPIVVGELTEEEVAELREAEPRLHALLANDHPARQVARNLFRLARLAQAPADQPSPRSEVDMAELWWRTGDGEYAGRRERARLLNDLARQSLQGAQVFDVSGHEAPAIEALIKSETLRDLGNDRVSFRHDVLREWAIASVLASDLALLEGLPLSQNAAPTLARGVELCARLALEKDRSPARWRDVLAGVSGAEAHVSWRRAALLATVHSELVEELIPLMGETFLAEEAAILRELLPIILAVDVQSAREMCLAAGIDASAVPDPFNLPSGPAWYHLASWLLQQRAVLPAPSMPEVVDFLVGWLSVGVIFPDPLSIKIIAAFKDWLIEIETSNDTENWRDHRSVFGGKLDSGQVKRIEEDLRTYLVLLANRAPQHAREYLASVQARRRKEDTYAKLLCFRGTLAQAAPDELAAITVDALVKPSEDAKQRRRERPLDDAFSHVDHQFLPTSPAQGPFFELLTHAPAIGLRLIRELIDKAIAYHTNGKLPRDDDVLIIETAERPRRFPWINTYGWSRASNYCSITSALMALETWAHARIEKGDAIDAVIADVIGAPDAPAAFVLVVVDILLSHWPATREAAVPYVACPELLSLDLSRPVQENWELPDILGLKDLQKEPAGPKLDALKNRKSRRVSLDNLLMQYAISEDWGALRERATILLQATLERLGAYEPDDSLADPRLMAVHAINLLTPENYIDAEMQRSDGAVIMVKQYVQPEAEAQHFAPHQAKAAVRKLAAEVAMAIATLVDHPERSSPEIATTLVQWAQTDKGEDAGQEAIDQALVGAALIAMRDGAPDLREQQRAWAEEAFAKVFEDKGDHVGGRMRDGVAYNPLAMAFAGRVFALSGITPVRADFERLLVMASGEPAVARGAVQAANALRELDERLPRAILRVAFAATFYTWHPWDETEATKDATKATKDADLKLRIEAELAWLCDGGAEPAWPMFPLGDLRTKRRGIRIGGSVEPKPPRKRASRNQFVDHQSAALWLRSLWRPSEADRAWLRDVYRAYQEWTLAANGAGLPEDEETAERPSEWNSIFFAVLANCTPGWSLADIETEIAPILDLADERFFDVSTHFLRSLDAVYFNTEGLDGETAAGVRARFGDRLAQSYGWRRIRGSRSDGGIEMHLGPAAAVQFFNDHVFGQHPKCYLFEKAVPKSDVFIAPLQALVVTAPSSFVAIALLNWLDVAPRLPQLPLQLAFAAAAVEVYPDDRTFWIDHGIGRRVCSWLEVIRGLHPDEFAEKAQRRDAIDKLLARLVAVGVVEARRLEIALSGASGSAALD